MIRELINFMNDLMSDIPDIMEWKSQPDKGLHVFIDIDSKGVWINKDLKKGIDYDYFDGKNKNIRLWDDCIRYHIIRKTKCYRFTKRNVPKRKTKRLRYRCPPEPYSNSVRTDFFSYSNAIILENQQINTSI